MMRDYNKNLKFEKSPQVREMLDEFYRKVFGAQCKIELATIKEEGIGIDVNVWDEKEKYYPIQEKMRQPKYWYLKKVDLYIELENGFRPNSMGWFRYYEWDRLEKFVYGWIGPEFSKYYIFMMDALKFENRTLELFKDKDNWVPESHNQKRNGEERRTTGRIISYSKYTDLIEEEIEK